MWCALGIRNIITIANNMCENNTGALSWNIYRRKDILL